MDLAFSFNVTFIYTDKIILKCDVVSKKGSSLFRFTTG